MLFFLLTILAHYSIIAQDTLIGTSVVLGGYFIVGFIRGLINMVVENRKMKKERELNAKK